MAKSSAATASGEISATNNLNKKAPLPLGALQTVDKTLLVSTPEAFCLQSEQPY